MSIHHHCWNSSSIGGILINYWPSWPWSLDSPTLLTKWLLIFWRKILFSCFYSMTIEIVWMPLSKIEIHYLIRNIHSNIINFLALTNKSESFVNVLDWEEKKCKVTFLLNQLEMMKEKWFKNNFCNFLEKKV